MKRNLKNGSAAGRYGRTATDAAGTDPLTHEGRTVDTHATDDLSSHLRGDEAGSDAWDLDDDEPEEAAPAEAADAEGSSHSPDDALGLYLRQMGAIPLLDRNQELTLAMRLEDRRNRYRMAALSNWRTLVAVCDTFQRVLEPLLT